VWVWVWVWVWHGSRSERAGLVVEGLLFNADITDLCDVLLMGRRVAHGCHFLFLFPIMAIQVCPAGLLSFCDEINNIWACFATTCHD
jgi:hypothetical protein